MKVTAKEVIAQDASASLAQELNNRDFKPEYGYNLRERMGDFAQLDDFGLPIPDSVTQEQAPVPPELTDILTRIYVGEHPEGVDRGGVILWAEGKNGGFATFNDQEEEWELS